MTATSPRMRDSLSQCLSQCLSEHPSALLLGEGVGALGGLSGASVGLRERFGAERVLDTPISDAGTLGLALGLALGGKRPIVELGGGLTAALPQLLGELDNLSRARPEFSAPVVLRALVGPEGDLLHPSPLRHLVGARGLDIVAPSTALDLSAALRSALGADHSTLILEPLELLDERDSVDLSALAPGRARVLREGKQVTVLSWGAALSRALEAADKLQDRVSTSVLDLCWLNPLDREAVLASTRRTGRLVIVCGAGEEPYAGSILSSFFNDSFLHLESPPQVLVGDADRLARGILDSAQY